MVVRRLNKKALRPFLDLKPLRVLTRKVDVKAWVSSHGAEEGRDG